MREKTVRNIKNISLFLGFFHVGSYLWFSDYYLSNLSLFTLFSISPGIALFILPLIPDTLLKYGAIRGAVEILGSIAILNIIHMMVYDFKYTHIIDIVADLFIHIGVLIVLTITLYRIVARGKKK